MIEAIISIVCISLGMLGVQSLLEDKLTSTAKGKIRTIAAILCAIAMYTIPTWYIDMLVVVAILYIADFIHYKYYDENAS